MQSCCSIPPVVGWLVCGAKHQVLVLYQVFVRRSHTLQEAQTFVKVLQSYGTLCTENTRVLSGLLS